jgi:hypothetical protein
VAECSNPQLIPISALELVHLFCTVASIGQHPHEPTLHLWALFLSRWWRPTLRHATDRLQKLVSPAHQHLDGQPRAQAVRTFPKLFSESEIDKCETTARACEREREMINWSKKMNKRELLLAPLCQLLALAGGQYPPTRPSQCRRSTCRPQGERVRSGSQTVRAMRLPTGPARPASECRARA